MEIDKDIMVIPAIAPAGNINHFDFSDTRNQTSYLEAERIGNAYGDIVISSMKNSDNFEIDRLNGFYREFQIPSREVNEHEIIDAKKNVEKYAKIAVQSKELTAEDLAKENEYVKLIFQKELLKYVDIREENYNIPFQAFFCVQLNRYQK